jgi:hypothetical protein
MMLHANAAAQLTAIAKPKIMQSKRKAKWEKDEG